MNQPRTGRGPRYQATLQLLRTAETLWNASRTFFARWDLSPSQFNVLNLLVALPSGMSQIELSRQLIMHRSNLTGLVDRLEARRLVKRLETPGDRRAYCVVLTVDGEKLMTEILPHYYRAAEQVWQGMSDAQVEHLTNALTTVCDNTIHLANAVTSTVGPVVSRKERRSEAST